MELPIDIIIRVDAKKENDSGEYTFQCKALGELVRCGECKHWDKWVCDKDGGHECIYNGGVWMADEFCSDGERKDGEHERTD